MVKFLIENKADINVKNIYGETALSLAKTNQHSEVVQLLTEKNDELNKK